MAKAPNAQEIKDAMTLITAARQTGKVLDNFLVSINRFNKAMNANIRKIDRASAGLEADVDEEEEAGA